MGPPLARASPGTFHAAGVEAALYAQRWSGASPTLAGLETPVERHVAPWMSESSGWLGRVRQQSGAS